MLAFNVTRKASVFLWLYVMTPSPSRIIAHVCGSAW